MQPPPQPDPPADPRPARRGPSNLQVLLGLFILWQLFFLFASNFLSIANEVRDDKFGVYHKNLPRDWKETVNAWCPGWLDKKGRLNDALETVQGLTSRWEQLTGQPQYWKLFAPNLTRDVVFLDVELRWDAVPLSAPAVAPSLAPLAARGPLDALAPLAGLQRIKEARPIPYAPELLPSENTPADVARFFRWGGFRLRKYEETLGVLSAFDPGDLEDARDQIRQGVKREWDTLTAYLRMRRRDYQARHPDRPRPSQVILYARVYHIPAPEDFSEDWYRKPVSVPVARWQPGVTWAPDYRGIECFNPQRVRDGMVEGRFEGVQP